MDGWLQGRSTLEQVVVWAIGGAITAFALGRLIPYRHRQKFAYIGYFAVFACVFSAAYLLTSSTPPKHLPHPLKSVPFQDYVDIELPDVSLDEIAASALEQVQPASKTQTASKEQPLAKGYWLEGRVVGVSDGDTVTLLVGRQNLRIRLAEIDTPERGQPWGQKAKQALYSKVSQKTIKVDVQDKDRYDRLVGKLWLGSRDVNREMVSEGHAWVYRRYMNDRSLLKNERSAKEQQLGLWSMPNPIEPWEWRKGRR